MKTFTSLEEAFENAEEVKHLKLSTEEAKKESFSQINIIKNLEHFEIDSDGTIKIPETILQLKKLRKLSFHGPREEFIKFPEIFLNLPIESLRIKNIRVNDILGMKQLKELNLVSERIYEDILPVCRNFPNLIYLNIWGYHSIKKSLIIPPEIKNLKKLEKLELVTCKLNNLPEELAELNKLKWIKLANHDFIEFPLVLAKLNNLEELNLSSTNITDVSALSQLNNLKKLNISNGKIIELAPLCRIKSLEILNIASCYKIKDFNSLSELKSLKKLNLDNTYINDLSPLLELPYLEELNVKYCIYLKDFTSLYKHPGLRVLDANEDIVKKWERRGVISFPSKDDILSKLKSGGIETVQQGFIEMDKYISEFSSRDSNAIYDFIGIDKDDYDETELIEIELLDQPLNKFGKKISSIALLAIINSTLKSMYDNFNATVTSIEFLIERRDIEAQEKIVDIFINACEYYDAGHRYWEDTVQDLLIDELFPNFEAPSLVKLLLWCNTDFLGFAGGGDDMCHLFIPAFIELRDEKLEKKLLDKFINYFYNDYGDISDLEYIIDGVLEDQASQFIKKEFKLLKEKLKFVNQIKKELISGFIPGYETKNVENIIQKIGKEIGEDDFLLLHDEFRKALKTVTSPINFDLVLNVVKSMFEMKWKPEYIVTFLKILVIKDISKFKVFIKDYFKNEPERQELIKKTLVLCKKHKYLQPLDKDSLDIIHKIYHELIDKPAPSSNQEKMLKEKFDEAFSKLDVDAFNGLIKSLTEIKDSNIAPQFAAAYTNNIIFELIPKGRLNEAKNIYDTYIEIFPTVGRSKKHHETLVAKFLALGGQLEDNDIINREVLSDLIPDHITNTSLAYNLSCIYALQKDKSKLLEYTQLALNLGKRKEQFLTDSDFKEFYDDQDFVDLLNKN